MDPYPPPAAAHRAGQYREAAGAPVGHGQRASSFHGGGAFSEQGLGDGQASPLSVLTLGSPSLLGVLQVCAGGGGVPKLITHGGLCQRPQPPAVVPSAALPISQQAAGLNDTTLPDHSHSSARDRPFSAAGSASFLGFCEPDMCPVLAIGGSQAIFFLWPSGGGPCTRILKEKQ